MATAPMTYCGYTPEYTEEVFLDLTTDPAAVNAAGVYTSKGIEIPAYATITDVIVIGVALWNAGTTAVGKVGDATDDDGFYTDINLKATELLAGETLSFAAAGGVEGAYSIGSLTHWGTLYSTSTRIIKLIITTVGTAPTTGETRMIVKFALPSPTDPALNGTYVAT